MASHLIHLAGPAIRARHVIRQRCAWCGALLNETDLERVAYHDPDGDADNPFINDDGSPKTRWEGLVAVEDHGDHATLASRTMWAVDDPADGQVPEDSCMALPTEATA